VPLSGPERAGGVSAGMALLRLVLRHRDLEALQQEVGDGPLREVLDRHEGGVRQALAVLDLSERPVDDGLRGCRNLFDAAAGVSGAAGVALYSLGDEAMLEQATAELVTLLIDLGVARPGARILDLGCGIGRLETALAGKVEAITGIDLSPRMIRLARTRCTGLPNVELQVCDGADLRMFSDGTFDAIVAVDTFPYLYQARGAELALNHVREAARVLAGRGDLVVLNLSYRGNDVQDVLDAEVLAVECGFRLARAGSSDLRTWDGLTFHFHRERA